MKKLEINFSLIDEFWLKDAIKEANAMYPLAYDSHSAMKGWVKQLIAREVQKMNDEKWTKLEEDEDPPMGECLVYLEEEFYHTRIHSASYHPNITFICGNFAFDVPKVTHWMPLPPSTEEAV